MERVTHEFQPVFNRDSRVLILGTFPSVKSRQQQFYYGHPQNRFWRVTAALLKKEVPVTIEEKKKMLLDGHIAIWDVIDTCDIEGSSDSSIRNVKANDIGGLLAQTSIRAVFANGDKACHTVWSRPAGKLSDCPPQARPMRHGRWKSSYRPGA